MKRFSQVVSDLKLIDWSWFAESMPEKRMVIPSWCKLSHAVTLLSHCCDTMSHDVTAVLVFRYGSHLCMLSVIGMLMPAYMCLCEACTCQRVAWDTCSCNVLAMHLGACDSCDIQTKITHEATIALLVPAFFAPDFTRKVSLFKNTCFSEEFVETHDDWLEYTIVFLPNA